MNNPNSYDDGAYTAAVNILNSNLPETLEKLWKAGASVDNIEDELSNCFENALGLPDVIVSIVATDV